MIQIQDIVFNKPEENIVSKPFSSLFGSEFLKDEINNIFPPIQNSDSKNKFFSLDKMSDIFDEVSLSLNEVEEDENENSIYFIKKQDNFDTESRSTLNSTNFMRQDLLCRLLKPPKAPKKHGLTLTMKAEGFSLKCLVKYLRNTTE